jgi:hypothetical protein
MYPQLQSIDFRTDVPELKVPLYVLDGATSSAGVKETDDRLTLALGPAEGPGSGGRQKIDALSAAIHPREHRVFCGAFDSSDPPKSMQERLVRLMAAASGSSLPATSANGPRSGPPGDGPRTPREGPSRLTERGGPHRPDEPLGSDGSTPLVRRLRQLVRQHVGDQIDGLLRSGTAHDGDVVTIDDAHDVSLPAQGG